MTDASPFDQLVGQVLEKRYRILKPLGEGGMGAVFLGEHVVIGRQVAIKVLHARLGQSQDFADRFAREAVAAGRLAHPNCVPVTDSGQLEDGTAYLVMELVKGRSLGDLLEDEGPRLEPVRALRIVRDVLRGLGHAHKMGIVHRDVKPDNVMLTERDDNPEFARVLDFGIAKLRDDGNKETEALTQAGMSVGTPTYLSPEQALGEDVDHRSDLYSTAVLLFEMLAGRPPFTAANPVGILTKHATSPVPRLWELAPELADHHELDDLVQHGLEKLRDDRFQDAAEFVEAIDRLLVNLGANLTPIPITGNFATEMPGAHRELARAQTGPHFEHTGAHHELARAQTGPHFEQTGAHRELARAQTGPYQQPTGPYQQQTSPYQQQTGPYQQPTGPHQLPTGPYQPQLPLAATDEALLPSSGGMQGRRAARSTSFVRQGLIAATIFACLVGGIWAATRSDSEPGNTSSSVVNTDQLLAQYVTALKEGATCKERLVAVKALELLNDERAIPVLKRARKRMRGGTLGFGANNTNHCLRKAAQEAIKSLNKKN